MKKKAFVTGGNGFLGVNLIKQLLENNWEVVAFHRPTSNLKYLKYLNVELVEGNLTDYQSIYQGMPEKVDAVFHAAANTKLGARHHEQQYVVNVIGTKNMLYCAKQKKAKHFIYTSSISAYGVFEHDISENTPSNIHGKRSNYYNYTKYLAEQEVKKAAREGLHAVIMNPCRIIGPYDTHNWASFIKMVHDKKYFIVPKGVGMVCHVRDVAKAHLIAVENGNSGENYLLGGKRASFKDIANATSRIINKNPVRHETPSWLIKLVGHISAILANIFKKEPLLTPEKARLLTSRVTCNFQKAKNHLNYQSTPFEKTIEETFRWIKKEKLVGQHQK
jgi:nucleoside-diphosphate-sugar epimerase